MNIINIANIINIIYKHHKHFKDQLSLQRRDLKQHDVRQTRWGCWLSPQIFFRGLFPAQIKFFSHFPRLKFSADCKLATYCNLWHPVEQVKPKETPCYIFWGLFLAFIATCGSIWENKFYRIYCSAGEALRHLSTSFKKNSSGKYCPWFALSSLLFPVHP